MGYRLSNGLWLVLRLYSGYRLWVIGYGLWVIGYRLWVIEWVMVGFEAVFGL